MAGTQNIGESSDNPVAINVTAMVDVIFCLCIFFMCSFHFKQLEGKIETWLPKGSGGAASLEDKVQLEDIRIVLRWDPAAARTTRQVGRHPPAPSDEALMAAVVAMGSDFRQLGKSDFPVLLEASRDVPWRDVVRVMDLCRKERFERIEFVKSAAPARADAAAK